MDLFLHWREQGIYQIHKLPTGEYGGVHQFMFTAGLLVGLDYDGYRCRWCYNSMSEAALALLTWDGKENPPGNWIKQKGRLSDGTVVDRSREVEQPLFR